MNEDMSDEELENMRWKLARQMQRSRLYEAMQTYADDILLRTRTASQMAKRVQSGSVRTLKKKPGIW